MKQIRVKQAQSGQRLDVALGMLDSSLSRSAWKNLIMDSKAKLNGKAVIQPSTIVKEGDKIAVALPSLPPEKPKMPIIYQDDDVIVYDKPAGILTHEKGGLAKEWTLAQIARPLVEDGDTNRPGVVHRLDRATSGVIILARTKRAKTLLQKQFARRQTNKTYLAIVKGEIKEQTFKIDLPLARNFKNPKLFSVNASGKPAQTTVNVLNSNTKASLVELKPQTGRTHQLRVHLSAIGHPIIGDDFYDNTGGKRQRMYLHAAKLKLKLPNGKIAEFESPLPQDFKQGIEDFGLA